MKARNPAFIVIISILIICLSGCLNQGVPPNTVDIRDSSFHPATITVNAGTTVTWSNHDDSDETVTATDGSFDSGNISTGYEFRYTFLQPGIYTYYSKAHPSMRGEVIVSSTSAHPNETSNITGAGQAAVNATGAAININLAAKDLAFDKKIITVPAGAKITVNFDNQDSGTPHNFAVYDTPAAQKVIFKGNIITGPAKTTYTFNAPATPGTYHFQCDVHPTTMKGQFIVVAAGSNATASASSIPASNQTASTAASSNQTESAKPASPASNQTESQAQGAALAAGQPMVGMAGANAASKANATAKPGSTGQYNVTSQANATKAISQQAAANAAGSAVNIELTANNTTFDKKTISVPAGSRVTIDFDNQDFGVPHNFAVYETSAAQKSIFKGDIITGPKKTTYTFIAPSKPGTYFFRCDVHPTQMTGQFMVT